MHKENTSVEEYLECLYKIEEEGLRARTNEIARRLGIKQSSVTQMLDRLSREEFVTHKEYHGAILTKKGENIGRVMTRKHRILEVFLYNALKIEKSRVHNEACRLEHALSDEVENKLVKLLKRPETCPDDGKPIPYAIEDSVTLRR